MGLGVSDSDARAISELEPEMRVTAEALGAGMADRLVELAPSLTKDGDNSRPKAEMITLALDREETPDPLSLLACLGAHRAYVSRRGDPEAVSLGALALARLLVWAARATLIGKGPDLIWLGPSARRPEPGIGQHVIAARARARFSSGMREAKAEALVREKL